jgi:hypothetical protein
MQRRDFLFRGGLVITAASFGIPAARAALAPEVAKAGQGNDRRPHPDDFTQPIMKALAYGMQAPSPHNTQAWKFKLINDHEALFFVDEKRLLPATDPPARQIHMGCGTFLTVLQEGIRRAGFTAKIELLPEGEYALDKIGTVPVARIQLRATAPHHSMLSDYIFSRQTSRLPYDSAPLHTREYEAIEGLAEVQHCRLDVVNQQPKLNELLLLLYRGMEVEAYDYSAYDETRQWFRIRGDIARKRDGINLRAMGSSGLQLWFAEGLLSGYAPAAWHNETAILSYLKTHYDAVMSSAGVITLTSDKNEQIDWIKAGMDYAKLQLAAFAKGYTIHPLSQVLQEFPAMRDLANDLNRLMGIAATAKVQMAVRIGRSPEAFRSYRRPLNDILIDS